MIQCIKGIFLSSFCVFSFHWSCRRRRRRRGRRLRQQTLNNKSSIYLWDRVFWVPPMKSLIFLFINKKKSKEMENRYIDTQKK